MGPRASVFVATSIDGYIARDDGSLDWLDKANAQCPAHEDGGFKRFLASVDTLVMGRNTFDMVMSFGQWPYGETPVIVLTNRPLTIKPDLQKTVTVSQESPASLVERLGAQGVRHIYVDGGFTIQSFLKARLIDTIIITLIPVALGSGISLFGQQEHDVALKLTASKVLSCGFMQLRYRVL